MIDARHTYRKRLGIIGLSLVVLTALCLTWGGAVLAALVRAGGDGDTDRGGRATPFAIAGDTTRPMTPGVMVPLNLRITNPHRVAMTVTKLAVALDDVEAPQARDRRPCTLADFRLRQPREALGLVVAARSTRTLRQLHVPRRAWPRAGMLNLSTNQDGCKGATLSLDYLGSGTLTY